MNGVMSKTKRRRRLPPRPTDQRHGYVFISCFPRFFVFVLFCLYTAFLFFAALAHLDTSFSRTLYVCHSPLFFSPRLFFFRGLLSLVFVPLWTWLDLLGCGNCGRGCTIRQTPFTHCCAVLCWTLVYCSVLYCTVMFCMW
jgi:hypothetical protein